MIPQDDGADDISARSIWGSGNRSRGAFIVEFSELWSLDLDTWSSANWYEQRIC